MHPAIRLTVDKRRVVSVTFERQSPDRADTPTIEVIYEVGFPDDFRLTNTDVPVLTFLSATRTDTRESVELLEEETREVLQCARNQAVKVSRGE